MYCLKNQHNIIKRLGLKFKMSNFIPRCYNYGKNPTIKLNNGCEMPLLGLGTWKSKPGEVYGAVKHALCVGYRHLDCAHVYENEKEVGRAIADLINEEIVTRDDIFVTSKLWNTYHGEYDRVHEGLSKTLTDLCVSHVDLYLIHWPFGFSQGPELFPKNPDGGWALDAQHHFCEVWKGMERLQKCGLARMIGISNFNVEQIETLLKGSEICPVVNQVECHPYLNQIRLSSFCREKSIVITAYSPLGARDFVKPGTRGPLDDYVVLCIAKNHGKTPAQVLIRYQIQRGHVVIPKSVNPERIAQNFEVFDFCLTEQEMNMLLVCERGQNGRIVSVKEAANHPEYPFKDVLPPTTTKTA